MYIMTLKNKNRLLIVFLTTLVFISFYLTYRRSFISKDFEIVRDSSTTENASNLIVPSTSVTEFVPTVSTGTVEVVSTSTDR